MLQVGKGRFQCLQTRAQGVIFGVRDTRRVIIIIGAVMGGDLFSETRVFSRCCVGRQVFDFRFHDAISSSAAARAASVTSAPDSMRAISSRRSLPSSATTRVRISSPSAALAIFQ